MKFMRFYFENFVGCDCVSFWMNPKRRTTTNEEDHVSEWKWHNSQEAWSTRKVLLQVVDLFDVFSHALVHRWSGRSTKRWKCSESIVDLKSQEFLLNIKRGFNWNCSRSSKFRFLVWPSKNRPGSDLKTCSTPCALTWSFNRMVSVVKRCKRINFYLVVNWRSKKKSRQMLDQLKLSFNEKTAESWNEAFRESFHLARLKAMRSIHKQTSLSQVPDTNFSSFFFALVVSTLMPTLDPFTTTLRTMMKFIWILMSRFE